MRPFLTLHDPATAKTYYNQGLWQYETFYMLLAKHAANMPSAFALRDSRLKLDWLSLQARVDALADDLAERGIGAGDRVSIWMSNRIEVMIASSPVPSLAWPATPRSTAAIPVARSSRF